MSKFGEFTVDEALALAEQHTKDLEEGVPSVSRTLANEVRRLTRLLEARRPDRKVLDPIRPGESEEHFAWRQNYTEGWNECCDSWLIMSHFTPVSKQKEAEIDAALDLKQIAVRIPLKTFKMLEEGANRLGMNFNAYANAVIAAGLSEQTTQASFEEDIQISAESILDRPVYPTEDSEQRHYGLTKRELFAAKAMAAIAVDSYDYSVDYVKKVLGADVSTPYDPEFHWPKFVAKRAVAYADALIVELAKRTQKEK